MTAEGKFKYALKEMLVELPLEEINVTLLCKKCNCHRQTFYYHYQDIYDLVAAILLSEQIEDMEASNTIEGSLKALSNYFVKNFDFFKSTYSSAAHELVDDFVYGKVMSKTFNIFRSRPSLSDNEIYAYRNISRRFSKFIADEYNYIFKDKKLTKDLFKIKTESLNSLSIEVMLPSFESFTRKETK